MKLLKEWEERDKGMGSGGGRGGVGNIGGMGRGRGGEDRGGIGNNQNQNRGRGYGATGPPGDRNQYPGGHRMLGHTSGRGGIGGAGVGAGRGGVGRGGVGEQNNRGRGFGMSRPYGDRTQTGGYRISGYGGYGYNGG